MLRQWVSSDKNSNTFGLWCRQTWNKTLSVHEILSKILEHITIIKIQQLVNSTVKKYSIIDAALRRRPGPWLCKVDLMTSLSVQKDALLWSIFFLRVGQRRRAEEREEAAWSEFSLPLSHLYSIEHHYQLSPFITHPPSHSHTHTHTHARNPTILLTANGQHVSVRGFMYLC